MSQERPLRVKDVATYLRVSHQRASRMYAEGKFPDPEEIDGIGQLEAGDDRALGRTRVVGHAALEEAMNEEAEWSNWKAWLGEAPEGDTVYAQVVEMMAFRQVWDSFAIIYKKSPPEAKGIRGEARRPSARPLSIRVEVSGDPLDTFSNPIDLF